MPTTQLYSIPTLKRNTQWYIEYFQLDKNGCRVPKSQKKLKCNLNRIKDLQKREEEAVRQLNIIKSKLGFKTQTIYNLHEMPIKDALKAALNIKIANVKSENPNRINKTIQVYGDTLRLFDLFLLNKGMSDIIVSSFKQVNALFFKDFLQAHKTKQGTKYRPRSINNHLAYMNALFNELKKREYVPINPFFEIGYMHEGEPIRRAFEPDERNAVLPEIFKNPALSFAVLLIYRTALRPIEVVQLKPKNFDFQRGLIRLGSEHSKARELQYVTIPADILPYFKNRVEQVPKDWYIFGEKLKPHDSKMVGEKILSGIHKKLIKKLLKEGILKNIEGLHLYSWKDTCAFDSIAEGYDIYSLMKHFRHKDITTTQKYFNRKGVINEKAQKSTIGVLPTF